MTNVWCEALDAIEFHLRLTQAALAAGTAPPAPLDTPLPAVAFPAELADRARSLLALTHQVESAAQGRLDRLTVALREMPSRRVAPARARTGTFVDVGA
jgi:hypothetical protein